ncbi:MAG: 3-deoxy-manno-octulosonate cytidylyltransferase [Lachnospiraceae bacterium]|nr:3-deoxy-manno-octulosonate cytidylyltransferase [Lachnospiraceae bacterium]
MKKVIAVIPARYESSRFPGKPLAMIAGKTMIERVYKRVREVPEIDEVFTATDDERIYDEVVSFGGKAVMTGQCSCGTERVYEAVKDLECDIVMNVQGDEPLIRKEMIRDLLNAMEDTDILMATLRKRIVSQEDIQNPNVVKVIVDQNDNALYFSRFPVPYNRDGIEEAPYFKHIGLYGYRKDFLCHYVKMPKSTLEKCENLEQLRVLENGFPIRVKETFYESIGVDLPEHIEQVERILKEKEDVQTT